MNSPQLPVSTFLNSPQFRCRERRRQGPELAAGRGGLAAVRTRVVAVCLGAAPRLVLVLARGTRLGKAHDGGGEGLEIRESRGGVRWTLFKVRVVVVTKRRVGAHWLV